jgi:hypothetical protein
MKELLILIKYLNRKLIFFLSKIQLSMHIFRPNYFFLIYVILFFLILGVVFSYQEQIIFNFINRTCK